MATAQFQTATTTVQAIINGVSQDLRSQLAASGSDSAIILDYVNRVQLYILRAVRWHFLLTSDILYFITQRDQTDYWIGATGAGPAGAVDTGLNLSDVDLILRNSVEDITNAQPLEKVDARPFDLTLTTSDAQFRPGPPAEWRQDPATPYLLQLYPAPDNNNPYRPIPSTPLCTTVAGGSLAQRTYYVLTTFVDSLGNEGSPSARENQITVPANKLLLVQSPVLPYNVTASGVTYNQYNVYVSTATQNETLQTASPVAYGTSWTEPTSGITTTGRGVPTNTINLTTMDGYIITFRYYKQRQVVSDPSQILQIPDVYKDIVIAGVNWLTSRFLRLHTDSQMWQMDFNDGIRQMIRDKNLMPKENDYIQPDKSGLGIGAGVPYQDFFGDTL